MPKSKNANLKSKICTDLTAKCLKFLQQFSNTNRCYHKIIKKKKDNCIKNKPLLDEGFTLSRPASPVLGKWTFFFIYIYIFSTFCPTYDTVSWTCDPLKISPNWFQCGAHLVNLITHSNHKIMKPL